jgi:hypothetical protein
MSHVGKAFRHEQIDTSSSEGSADGDTLKERQGVQGTGVANQGCQPGGFKVK